MKKLCFLATAVVLTLGSVPPAASDGRAETAVRAPATPGVANTSGTLPNAARPLGWTGTVGTAQGPIGEVPECAPGCDRFDLTIALPADVWNESGGVQVAIRWTGQPFDNLRLYVYRDGALVAKSDGIISISQGVLLPEAANGLHHVYLAHDSDSPSSQINYEGLAEVEFDPKPFPVRRLIPELEVQPQANLSFVAGGFPFDEVSPDFPSCYKTEVEEDGAQLCLRFDRVFANTAEGALELRFKIPDGPGPPPATADVFQRLYWSDDPASFDDRPAGTVEYHSSHGHYHFVALGLSNLWSIDSEGHQIGTQPIRQRLLRKKFELVRAGDKVSFCLADT
jgi:hypothetical protein